MDKKAILYTRVSTDEQAQRGYSLNDQHEKLKAYCRIHNIEVVEHFQDDHSAKSFDRPAFKKLIEYLKQNKKEVNLLLFIKWDRFSRNATESYEMLKMLKFVEVEAQAIDQPLDLNVPENKLMLALYLASPEVENDRRALNVSVGMRRAAKEGRWVVKAPLGYSNKRDENNRPVIVPSKYADCIRQAFEAIETGEYSQEVIRKKLCKENEGFICSKNNFSRLLRNPVYMGMIQVRAKGIEDDKLYKGIHQPIISEATFNNVQAILSGRMEKGNFAKIHRTDPKLPLRGFLKCPDCGKMLTGSASRGHGGIYYYYHCVKGCKARFKAPAINGKFLEKLKEFEIPSTVKYLYDEILKELLLESENGRRENSKIIDSEILKLEGRIANLQDKLADNQISNNDYNSAKQRYDLQLLELREKKKSFVQLNKDIYEQLIYSFSFLQNLPLHFSNTALDVQQQIIGSIYPGKIEIDGENVRTPQMNRVALLMLNINKPFGRNEKGQFCLKSELSQVVTPKGLEPPTLRTGI